MPSENFSDTKKPASTTKLMHFNKVPMFAKITAYLNAYVRKKPPTNQVLIGNRGQQSGSVRDVQPKKS